MSSTSQQPGVRPISLAKSSPSSLPQLLLFWARGTLTNIASYDTACSPRNNQRHLQRHGFSHHPQPEVSCRMLCSRSGEITASTDTSRRCCSIAHLPLVGVGRARRLHPYSRGLPGSSSTWFSQRLTWTRTRRLLRIVASRACPRSSFTRKG